MQWVSVEQSILIGLFHEADFFVSLTREPDLTAAVGMCVRNMNKEDMEKCGDLMRSILQGVTSMLCDVVFWVYVQYLILMKL